MDSISKEIYEKLDIKTRFNGEIFIMGVHLPSSEIFQVLQKNDYLEDYQFIHDVDYVYVSFGRLPKDLCDAEGNGWFVIDNPQKYKRKKKATVIVVKEFEAIRKCPECKTNRVWIMNGEAKCNLCGFKFNYKPLSFCKKCFNNSTTIHDDICGRCGAIKPKVTQCDLSHKNNKENNQDGNILD